MNKGKKPQDLTGRKFNRLTVVALCGRQGRKTVWKCQCDCGNTTEATIDSLNNGRVKSCGCLKRDMNTTHGHTGTPTYRAWKAMFQRCMNPSNPNYKNYGGRGITVCERWMTFENFLADMGERPHDDLSIDRINNDGHYEPGNCRWATASEQCRNRRSWAKNATPA